MRISILILVILSLGACASSEPITQPGDSDFATPDVEVETYIIGVGDVLSVHVWDNPDLSLSVPVRPDGFISMPLIGDVTASGLNAESLAANITVALETQLRNPQVTVIVNQVNSAEYMTRVRVTGAVGAQRSIPYARGMSVLDAILEAGSLSPTAAGNRATLLRQVNGEMIRMELRLDDILNRGRLETNYPLRPGDVISVPESFF